MRTYYNVAPRYTCGSPAQVDRTTYEVVAAQEWAAYTRAKSGRLGEEEQRQAQHRGVGGIAYTTMEKGTNVLVFDFLEDRHFRVPTRWWCVEGAERRGTSWHARQDRDQFEVRDGGTRYEQRGRVYAP